MHYFPAPLNLSDMSPDAVDAMKLPQCELGDGDVVGSVCAAREAAREAALLEMTPTSRLRRFLSCSLGCRFLAAVTFSLCVYSLWALITATTNVGAMSREETTTAYDFGPRPTFFPPTVEPTTTAYDWPPRSTTAKPAIAELTTAISSVANAIKCGLNPCTLHAILVMGSNKMSDGYVRHNDIVRKGEEEEKNVEEEGERRGGRKLLAALAPEALPLRKFSAQFQVSTVNPLTSTTTLPPPPKKVIVADVATIININKEEKNNTDETWQHALSRPVVVTILPHTQAMRSTRGEEASLLNKSITLSDLLVASLITFTLFHLMMMFLRGGSYIRKMGGMIQQRRNTSNIVDEAGASAVGPNIAMEIQHQNVDLP